MSETTEGAAVDLGIPSLGTNAIADIPPLEAPTLEPNAPSELAPTTERKRRRRRTKAQMQAAAAPEPVVDVGPSAEDIARLSVAFGAAFSVMGNVLAMSRGEHWRFTDAEIKALGDAWAPALAPYMGGAGKYMPFVLAGVTTVGVILPRVQADNSRALPPSPVALAPTIEVVAKTDLPPVATIPAPDAAQAETPGEATIPIDPPPRRTARRTAARVSP